MPAPLFKVEVAFADGPNAAAPTYTDISAYVRRDPPLTYSRGNVDETQQLQAGQMSFTVDNADGRFTVGSSASTSAWGTVLKIRRPVRLSIWDGTAYQVAWTGTVDDWGAGWMGGVKGLSQVTCSDRAATAGRITLPDIITGELRAAVFPGWFFTTSDTSAPLIESVIGEQATLVRGTDASSTVAYRQAGPGVDDAYGITLASSTGTGYGFRVTSSLPWGTIAQASIGAWIKTSTVGSGKQVVVQLTNGTQYTWLYIDTSGRIIGEAVHTTTGTVTGPTVTDGLWHHVAAVVSGGTVNLYVDGTSAGSAAVTSPVAVPTAVYFGTNSASAETLVSGTISFVHGSALALTSTQIGNIASAGSATYTETTGARWNRLCRVAGLSSTWYTADTGSGALLQQGTSGTSLASVLSSVAFVEQGAAFASAAGVLTLKAREARYNKSSTLTLAPQTVDRALQFTANDAYLVNTATVQTTDGASFYSSDSTSVTDHGTYSTQTTVNSPSTNATAANLAQWLVYRYRTPSARARGLSINGTTKASSVTATQLLALDVNSRITLSPLTGPVPSSSVQVFIDGLSGSIGDQWQVTYNTSPTTGLDGLVLDTSALDNAASILLY